MTINWDEVKKKANGKATITPKRAIPVYKPPVEERKLPKAADFRNATGQTSISAEQQKNNTQTVIDEMQNSKIARTIPGIVKGSPLFAGGLVPAKYDPQVQKVLDDNANPYKVGFNQRTALHYRQTGTKPTLDAKITDEQIGQGIGNMISLPSGAGLGAAAVKGLSSIGKKTIPQVIPPAPTIKHSVVYGKQFTPVSRDEVLQDLAKQVADMPNPRYAPGLVSRDLEKKLSGLGAQMDSISKMSDAEWASYAQKNGMGNFTGTLPKATRPSPIPVKATETPVQPRNPQKGTEIPKEQTFVKNADLPKAPKEEKFVPLGADTNRFEEVAMALTDTKQVKPTMLEQAAGITGNLKRKFVDAGDTVAKISKANNDKGLYALYNNARNARKRAEYHIGEAQTDIYGREVGKSLKDIFDPIRKKGDAYYEDFQEYMYHLHNVDRMAQGKPVFGESITAEESKKVSDFLLQKYPEFAQEAGEVRKYLDNMMQYRVQGGLVSEDSAKALAEMYQNYVPTYRLNPTTKGMRYSGQITDISTGVKKATGSSKDLLPLHEQIARQTMQAVDASHKNLFGVRLAENINPQTQKYIQELKKAGDDFDIDVTDMPELKNTFNIYKNGEAYQMKVDDTLYEGIKALAGKDSNELLDIAQGANKAFKELITSWNPMFLVRNIARDIQDVGLYTKDLKGFAKMYPSAIKEITTNGEIWKRYKALGGAGNSFFDYAKGYKKDASWLRRNTLDRVEQLNLATEQLPRFAEFMSTIDRLGHSPSYDELMEAMYNAADVTVNFGRSGTWGKTLNSTFVPFFNPAIQGSSKVIRRFTETKGVKEWTSLILKISALGVAPSLINEMMYMDDPQYQSLNDRDKDINFLFKIGDGEWVKIPKGRVLSMFGSAAQRGLRMANGDSEAYAGFIKTAENQVAPISPFESNILSPFTAVKNNTSWYGGKIEPQRLEKYSPGLRFDESTTSLAKAVGGTLNYSPKKIDYLLDAYSGVIGDFALPLTTPKAERNPFVKAFSIDSVLSNEISQKFYDKKDEINYARNDVEGQDKYDILNRYMNKQADMTSDLYNEIRKIENGLGTDNMKRQKVRELKAIINGIEQTALDTLPEIEKTTESLSRVYKDPEDLYREVNKKVFGAKYALQVYDKKVYEKAVASQIGFDKYYDSYFAQKDQASDVGKAIALEKKKLNTYKAFGISDKSANMAKAITASGLSESYNNTYAKLKGVTGSEDKMNIINQSNPGLTRDQLVLLYEVFDISQGIGRYARQFN